MKSRDLTRWERAWWADGLVVAGVDEVGRGPLAGPVVAAVVVFERHCPVAGVNDSKQLSERQREMLFLRILDGARAVAVGAAGPRTIEAINILEASRVAMRRALGYLGNPPDVLLTDAVALGGPWREAAILQGDATSASIAAASIVAKVVRDRYMRELARQFPAYGFDRHKGYATRSHRDAILRHGPCEAHRRTFLRKLLLADPAVAESRPPNPVPGAG